MMKFQVRKREGEEDNQDLSPLAWHGLTNGKPECLKW